MKIHSSIIVAILLLASITTEAQLRTPALSPQAKVFQTVGLTDLEVRYYRPSAKGRVIFGTDGLVPYGQEWRLGANGATKLIIGDNVQIDGQEIAKGDYALVARPGPSAWRIDMYPYASSLWSSYLKETPKYSVIAQSTKSPEYVETFTIAFEHVALDEVYLTFAWADTKATLPIKVEVHERTMKAIRRTLEEPNLNDYFSAATYIYNTKGDLDQALAYMQKVTSTDKVRFFHFYLEAQILKDLHRNTDAIYSAEKSLKAAKQADNKDFIRLNEKLLKELR